MSKVRGFVVCVNGFCGIWERYGVFHAMKNARTGVQALSNHAIGWR